MEIKCPQCDSLNTRKNGRRRGKQSYQCRDCGRQFVEDPSAKSYSAEVRELCLKMHRKGMKLREIERVTEIHHTTILKWIKDLNLNCDRLAMQLRNHSSRQQ